MKRIIFILMITVFAFNVFAVGSVFDDTIKIKAISNQEISEITGAVPTPVVMTGTINPTKGMTTTKTITYNEATVQMSNHSKSPVEKKDVIKTSFMGGSNSLKVFNKAIPYLSCILTILIILSANVVKKKYVIKNVNTA